MSTVSHAQMYKWVDEDGVTQYTQTPPPGEIQVETIEIQTGPASELEIWEMENQVRRLNLEREARLLEEQNKQIDKENAAIQAENCQRSRQRLASYSVPNALILQADGSRIRVDEDARQRELAATRELISQYCKPYVLPTQTAQQDSAE
ncbi:MAG: DUF4124 domain-containing protein [Gammaproteobacteria bacterium]|nr:DUF4124 domain-containing protein [Gammaproteobacteria bacterium]